MRLHSSTFLYLYFAENVYFVDSEKEGRGRERGEGAATENKAIETLRDYLSSKMVTRVSWGGPGFALLILHAHLIFVYIVFFGTSQPVYKNLWYIKSPLLKIICLLLG